MFVKKNSCKNGRILLTFTRGFRENGKNKQKHVETLGYLDDLEKIYDDPIAHFREIAKQRTQVESVAAEPIRLTLDPTTEISQTDIGLKNLGYAVLEKIYHELGIHTFFQRHENRLNINFNLNAVFRLLVYSRILDPGSKKQAFDQQNQFFETMAPTLESVYRSLDYFDRYNLDLQSWVNEVVKNQYGRNEEYAYYDVTNYYFEIDEEDELRRRGPSKEHRPNPIIQMGLLIDSQGLPLAYHLFPGNQSEKLSLNPLLNRLKEDYGLGRLVVVADKGLNVAAIISPASWRKATATFTANPSAVQIRNSNNMFWNRTVTELPARAVRASPASTRKKSPLPMPWAKRKKSGSTRSKWCSTARIMRTRPATNAAEPLPKRKSICSHRPV